MGLLRAFEGLFFTVDADDNVDSEERDARGQPRVTVLAIDDDPVLLDSVAQLLRDMGFNVLTSKSGAKGLDMLNYAAQDVRVVILDYGMPQLNGEKTLEYVRRLNPTAKVIGLTGYKEEDLPASYRDGVDRLLTKPFRSPDLVLVLRELAAARA
jgi:two-component system, cell cycle sensor histidine kinase and response regulator CckA